MTKGKKRIPYGHRARCVSCMDEGNNQYHYDKDCLGCPSCYSIFCLTNGHAQKHAKRLRVNKMESII